LSAFFKCNLASPGGKSFVPWENLAVRVGFAMQNMKYQNLHYRIQPKRESSSGVRSKKFEQISPKICRAGGRAKTKPPFRPPRLEAEAKEKRTISSFSRAVARKKNHN